ncbi:Dipeptide transport system permease protein DppC [Hyphomicrobiales bacterium]|nr:Dipeptide transport system permease protein DppC [Hyphomicrobiales bacterium]CAH1698886.1 Dipeptide transport system permease protein DppC [Hyphomicrobiales bacterium]CAI0342530.1 Dipeptide transport system permease protein DppC [Hyphomicrobiales bacterium]
MSLAAPPRPAARRRRLQMPVSVMIGLAVVVLMLAVALLAPWIAPTDPTNVASFDLMNAELPPAFMPEGDPKHWLGTDNQGRDLFSAILYGMRVSIAIGGGAVIVAASIGVVLGLLAGYFGGWVDVLIMRVGDVILSLPTILLALLVSGIARAVFPEAGTAQWAPVILIGAIAIHEWVQYARTVRAATMVEASKDYVRAARVIGLPPLHIMVRHILPNVMSPVMVIATINLAAAVLTEATLSFLGVGMPPTYPSLGTLIRIGNEFVFSGIWWIAVFPAVTLVVLVLAVNVVGDWLRDRFNPKLKGR